MTWRSKKQSVVSSSSAESEYRALALGMWLQRLLGITTEKIIGMFSDSPPSAISIAYHDRTKHIKIDKTFYLGKCQFWNSSVNLYFNKTTNR